MSTMLHFSAERPSATPLGNTLSTLQAWKRSFFLFLKLASSHTVNSEALEWTQYLVLLILGTVLWRTCSPFALQYAPAYEAQGMENMQLLWLLRKCWMYIYVSTMWLSSWRFNEFLNEQSKKGKKTKQNKKIASKSFNRNDFQNKMSGGKMQLQFTCSMLGYCVKEKWKKYINHL